jgi:hypothetical protein
VPLGVGKIPPDAGRTAAAVSRLQNRGSPVGDPPAIDVTFVPSAGSRAEIICAFAPDPMQIPMCVGQTSRSPGSRESRAIVVAPPHSSHMPVGGPWTEPL